ncbi:MAG: FGGY-family carbohydrate kinase [Actinomycetota bacterium]
MSLLGIDIGTTGCKAVVFSRYGSIISSAYREHKLIHPHEGYSELDAEEIFHNIAGLVREVSSNLKNDRIEAFGVSCQGEAIIAADKEFSPLYNAIVTFDQRTKEQYLFWKNNLGSKEIFNITGMPLHPMYSINKVMWIKKYMPHIYRRTHKFLCFEDYLFARLGLEPTIDYSLAARTMAFDINRFCWSRKILKIAGIEQEMLAGIKPSGKIVGQLDKNICSILGLEGDVYAVTGGHDQACGAFGSGVHRQGYAANATGTSDVLISVMEGKNLSADMLKNNYSCYPYVSENKYMTISFNLTGGLLLRWYRDQFCSEESREAARTGKDTYEVIINGMHEKPVNLYILPHFVGSGTPYMDSESRGIIAGLNLQVNKPRIARAIIQSSSFDLRLNVERLGQSGIKIDKLVATGGGAESEKWLQIKADIIGKEIETLKNTQAASLGAAMLAGIAIGKYSSFGDAIRNTIYPKKQYYPNKKSENIYNKMYEIYKSMYDVNRELLHKISKLEQEEKNEKPYNGN